VINSVQINRLEKMMTQRLAMILAGALTVFVLMLIVGVAVTVAIRSFVTAHAVVQPAVPAATASTSTTRPIAVKLSSDQAVQIAVKLAPQAKVVRVPELVSYQGTVAYEVLLNQGSVYVDANNGQVLYKDLALAQSQTTGQGNINRTEHEREEQEGDDHD
jgi:hypothetical protein